MSLNDLSATQAVDKIQKGEITSEELVQACIERIAQIDGEIEAWSYFNSDYALEQARKLDLIRQAGESIGPLHGIPIGIKDIIDTAHVPTELRFSHPFRTSPFQGRLGGKPSATGRCGHHGKNGYY